MTQPAIIGVASADRAHEQKIKTVMDEYLRAALHGDRDTAGRKWIEVVGLIANRSPRQVKRMERERGLDRT